jgi:hypothetical protein
VATLQLASDLPAESPGFGFTLMARVLADTLASPQQGAMVLGLHGGWGSGKSTLMRAILRALRGGIDNGAIIIEFNAWKYQNREALWRALIVAVLAALRRELPAWPKDEQATKERQIGLLERSLYASFTLQEKGSLQVNWTGLATEIVLTIIRVAGGGLVGGLIGQAGRALRSFFDMKDKGGGEKDVSGSVERVAGILQREVAERNVEQVQAIDQFLDRYQKLTADLGRFGKRIYVLIDDLDRCLPDEALTVFEAIKLFLDAPECRYVVAIDRSMIRRGLALRYERSPQAVDPDEYIEKTISLSFDLPQIRASQARQLLYQANLATIAGGAGGGPVDDPWHTAIIEALGTNPRRLKRVANTLRLMRALARESGRPISEADSPLLLKLGLIAYRNSGVFDALRRDPRFGATLQQVANRAAIQKWDAATIRAELPVQFHNLAEDNGFWVLLRRQPDLTEEQINLGAAWFQPEQD